MNVNIEEVSSIKRKLTIELPEETADKTRKKHLDNYARKARLKGFRPGKAPKSLVAKAYAEELHREVVEELVGETMPTVLSDHKLEPVGMPLLENVDYEDGQPFKFTVSVEIRPTFESPKWQGLDLKKLKSEVNDEMVDKKLEELRFSLATVKTVEEDRPLVRGDLANITYQGYDGENIITDMKAGPFNVELGSDRLTPEFEQGLEGMKAGETKDIEVVMPEDLEDKKMAGKHVTLRTTVNEVRQRELPELDDEFAKDMGIDDVETLEALKAKIRADLQKEQENVAEREFNKQLTDILASLVEIEVPSAMVDREVTAKIETMRNNFGRNGLNFKKMGIDVMMLRDRFRPEAVKNVTAALVLDQIARDNHIEITDEDIEKELAEMSEDYGQPVEVLRDYYKSRNLMDNLREGLKVGKTLEMIREQANITEVDKLEEPEAPVEEAQE
ncbi:trigger factor [Deltaproteobacteria bacterium Smac51]|nr:trigger factor [Deltaproteobacteria bacterium Smac51]